MSKFRSKPFVVEAVQWFKDGDHPAVTSDANVVGSGATVRGKNGLVSVSPGDWIITEPDGSGHYPCKPDVFAAKYEPDEPAPPDGAAS